MKKKKKKKKGAEPLDEHTETFRRWTIFKLSVPTYDARVKSFRVDFTRGITRVEPKKNVVDFL